MCVCVRACGGGRYAVLALDPIDTEASMMAGAPLTQVAIHCESMIVNDNVGLQSEC